jgi:hypothetical protein
MTRCDKCGKEAGNLFCGHCKAEIHKRHTLVPVLFYDKEKNGYRAGCSCIECPANENGVCITVHKYIDDVNFHSYDGDNCVKELCG